MLKTKIDLKNHLPISRQDAARIASAASVFPCTLTLECEGILLNLKSMIGLLSQSISKNGLMYLVADGDEELAATEALIEQLTKG